MFRRKRPSTTQNKSKAASSTLPESASSSSMASSSSGSGGLGLPLVELTIPRDDFRGSVIITNLAKRFSILREAQPTRNTHLPLNTNGRPPVSIDDIRLRLADQRQRATRERGEQDGKRWFVTEEEEDIVLEELVFPQDEVSVTSPVADFRRSPSDWSISRSTTSSNTFGSMARSHSASETSTGSLSSMVNDTRMARPPPSDGAGPHSKSYGISSGSQMRDKEIMRVAASRGAGKMKRSAEDGILNVAPKGKSQGKLVIMKEDEDDIEDEDMTPRSLEIAGRWTPPVSATSSHFKHRKSSLPSPLPGSSRLATRKSLLDGFSSESLRRISMALGEIEEELTATRQMEHVESEILNDNDNDNDNADDDGKARSSKVKPLTPHRSNQLSSSSSNGSIGPTSAGHERKTSITRSPAYHDSLSVAAHRATLVEERSPSPSPAPATTRTNLDRAPALPRISSRAGKHNRQPSATSQLKALLPDPPSSAPISHHARSASSSPFYPGMAAPVLPVTLTRMRSASTTSAGASPVSRDSIISGYVPGDARPFTPPRSTLIVESGNSTLSSQLGGSSASHNNTSRIAAARAGGENRPQLFIKPGLTVPMVRSASGGRIPSVSPVTETFEASEPTPTDVTSAWSQHTSTPRVSGLHSNPSSLLAPWDSLKSPEDQDAEAGDVTFDTTAYYGQPSPVRRTSLVEGLDVLDTESRQLGETSRYSSRTSLDSQYNLEERDDDLEAMLFPPPVTTCAINATMADHDDDDDDVWDITREQMMTLQNKLVNQAKAIRLEMNGPDEISPRPSPNPADTLQHRPSRRLRRTEMSTFAMREEVGQLEIALSPPVSAEGYTPVLQRQPTTSSTVSSNFACTPSSANDGASPADNSTVANHFPDGTANDSAYDSFAGDKHRTPLTIVTPHLPDSQPSRSRNLADDPAVRKQFEEKIAQATAELQRNASTGGKLSRKNTRTKASQISNPQLLSSSSKFVTNPISSPRMEQSGRIESPRDASSTAGRIRKLAGLGTSKDAPDSPLASRADAEPNRLNDVSFVKRTESKKAVKEVSMSNAQPALHRGNSTGFRGLIGKLRTKGVTEPLFEEVSPLVAEEQPVSPPTFARTQRYGAQTNSVVRRTIIVPHQSHPSSTGQPELSMSGPFRKPSTRRKPVKALDDAPATSIQPPVPQAHDPQSLHTRAVSSRYSQPGSDGSILDMYMENEDENDSFDGTQVRDAVEICEMSDGNVIWNVLESGRTVESHEMAANHTLQHPAEMSSAFQLSIKGPSSNQLAKLGQTRPETKVYFSSSAQMADLIEDISRDLDSGRFDIVPSGEAATATPTQTGQLPPLSTRLQSLLTHHLGTAKDSM